MLIPILILIVLFIAYRYYTSPFKVGDPVSLTKHYDIGNPNCTPAGKFSKVELQGKICSANHIMHTYTINPISAVATSDLPSCNTKEIPTQTFNYVGIPCGTNPDLLDINLIDLSAPEIQI